MPPRLQQAHERIDAWRAQLARSADLRLRIVFSIAREPDAAPGSDGTVHVREIGSTSSLVDQARGSTDPVALHLLMNRCGTRARVGNACNPVDLARRWTVVDTQNQVAWLALVGALRAIHDEAGARDAFVRAGAASRWHEDTWDVMQLVDDAAPRDFPAVERLAWAVDALGVGFAAPLPPMQSLWTYCKEGGRTGGALRSACLRIIETMVRDADSIWSATVAPTFAAYAGASDAVVVAYRQRSDALVWALAQDTSLDAALFDSFGPGIVDEATAARAQPLVRAIIRQSERTRAERYLLEQRVSASDAARRYAAALSPAQREHRTEVVVAARAWAAADASGNPVVDLSAGSARSTTASP